MRAGEDGNVTILTLLLTGSLAMALIIALEFACVYAQKLVYDNYLNIAREETFSAGFDMQLKSSDDPVGLIGDKLVEALRDNGYDGAAYIEYYEATRSQIEGANPGIDSAENVRVIAWCIRIETEYANVAAPAAWLGKILLSSETSASMCPYALHKTYRPSGIEGQVWECRVGEGEDSVAPQRGGGISDALAATLDDALKKPTELFEANQ